jgi:glycosyltransferase involved in cell wall biosynthesis
MNARVIFVKTPDTRNILNLAMQEKTVVFIEVGTDKARIRSPRAPRQAPPKLLYAGRLLYWKGVHIAIQAFAKLLPRIHHARLTIVGSGPEETRLKSDILFANIGKNVDFISWLPQQRLFELYESHDLLLFPSLHDSSGGVVLEALCHGMPVVCLDVGGPKEIVTPASGLIIKTDGRNTSQVASIIADELCDLLRSPTRVAQLSSGAISRANDFILPNRVAGFYQEALRYIEDDGTRFAPPLARSRAEESAAPFQADGA